MNEYELQALWNSYKVVTKIMTFTDIMLSKPFTIIPFAHDPDSDPSIEDLDRFIRLFEEMEEYESCDNLNKIKNEIQRLSNGDNSEFDERVIYGEICIPSYGSSYWEDFNQPWYMSDDESQEGSFSYQEEGHIISEEGLREFITDLFNRSN